MAVRRPTGGVGSNQYQTVGTPTVRPASDRVAAFGGSMGGVSNTERPQRARVPRSKCGECGSSFPTEQTALVYGERSGNYRTPARPSKRRVCKECTVEHVKSVRRAQSEGRHSPLDTTYIPYSAAARELGVFIDDLWVDDYDRRTGWAERREAIPAETLATLEMSEPFGVQHQR